MKKVLVVAAHPDDEVLGVGGTIARHVAEGDSVSTVILAQGVLSRRGQDKKEAKNELNNLYRQAYDAAKILGVKDLVLAKLPDQMLDTIPKLDLYNLVETHIQRVRPTIVYTHNDADLNWDHKCVSEATLWACRTKDHSPVNEIYLFEVPSSTEQSPKPCFVPHVYVDIVNQLEKKIEALSCYKGELRPFPHPRSPEGIRIAAQYRGMEAGLYAAEAFKVFRVIK